MNDQTQPDRQKQVPAAIHQLETAVESITLAFTDLKGELKSVLNPEPDDKADTQEIGPALVASGRCATAEQINSQVTLLNRLTDKIIHLETKVEA